MRQLQKTLVRAAAGVVVSFCVVITVLGMITTPALAAPLAIAPNSVVGNTLGEFSTDFDIGNAIDQSGLSPNYVSGVTDVTTYLALPPTHNPLTTIDNNSYASPKGITSGNIDFDLGSVFSISRFLMWADDTTGSQDGSPKEFSLFTATDVNFTTPIKIDNFTGASGSGADDPIPVQVFEFLSVDTQFIRFSIHNTYGISLFPTYTESNAPNVNIGELAFGGDTYLTPVPLPAAFPLFGAGLGFLGFLGWRRRRKAQAV